MKVIKMNDLPGVLPPKHYKLLLKRVVDPSIGAKAMGVSLGVIEPKGGAEPHVHEKAEQLFIIVKGEMLMKTDKGEACLKAGEAAFIEPGEVHENCNVSDGETEYFVITSHYTD